MERTIKNGFALTEIIIVIAISAVLFAVAVSGFFSYKNNAELNNGAQEFVGILRLAQSKALSSDSQDKYGIYINTAVSPNQYVLFKGASYVGGTTEQTYLLPSAVEFYNISVGGGNEIVFNRITGECDQAGSVSLRLKTNQSLSKTVYIFSSGAVSYTPGQDSLDNNRAKDARHVVFNYNQTIDTVNGIITLIFNGNKSVPISISSYISGGQIKYHDTTEVDGSDQTVQIETIYLNNPNSSQFSIFRDRRYNDKSLDIVISGDSSGYLVQWPADGLTADYKSDYVSEFSVK